MWLYALVFVTGVYGGYFGAAQGVILMGLLGVFIADDLQRLNGTKNALALLVNVVSAVFFVSVTHVAWSAAGLVAAGAVVGGQVGGVVGRRLAPGLLRLVIVAVGVTAAAVLLGAMAVEGADDKEPRVRLGIVTPVVNLNPRFDPPASGGAGRHRRHRRCRPPPRIAATALCRAPSTCASRRHGQTRGGRYWDPVGHPRLPGRHHDVHRAPYHVLVLGYHHPLEVLKRYGSLGPCQRRPAHPGSRGGNAAPRFELLQVPFADRGARADEAMLAIRNGCR